MSLISQTLREVSLRQRWTPHIDLHKKSEVPLSQEKKNQILTLIDSITTSFIELLEVTESVLAPQTSQNERGSWYWWNWWRQESNKRWGHFPKGGIKGVRSKKNQLVESLWNLSGICMGLQEWENTSLEVRKIIRQITEWGCKRFNSTTSTQL